MCVYVLKTKKTVMSVFESHESKVDYKVKPKEEMRQDPRRKKERDRKGKRETD